MTFHTTAAFHYAHRFYSERDRQGGERHDRRGLVFPGAEEPGTWDFLYHAFVIGMTAQVSDVQISDTSMRRLALFHSAASFFFNTVILALVVSVVLAVKILASSACLKLKLTPGREAVPAAVFLHLGERGRTGASALEPPWRRRPGQENRRPSSTGPKSAGGTKSEGATCRKGR